jgi:hypothetical protein
LVAEWWLKSERVASVTGQTQRPPFAVEMTISVPAQIYDWKASADTRTRAQEIQERNRASFRRAFQNGLSVLGYERDAGGNGNFLLGSWHEKWYYGSPDR